MNADLSPVATLRQRIPLPEPDDMTPAQRRVYEEVVTGRRGRMVGPLRAVIHNPDLAQDWSRLGARLRYDTSLEVRYSELAIIVTARYWASDVEWAIHAREAIEVGVPVEIVTAIGAGLAPDFAETRDAVIYDFTCQLLTKGRVDFTTYGRVREHWGDVGTVELTALIGYYSMVAMMLNAHEIPAPVDGADIPPMDGVGRQDLPIAVSGGRR